MFRRAAFPKASIKRVSKWVTTLKKIFFLFHVHWNSHINSISAKANHTIGFLRRNIHSCPKEVKAAAYTTLVRPSIEYASSVWDPYTRNNIHQLEAIQRRAARFVYNNFYDREPGVVTSMISRLQWESLEQRRDKSKSNIHVQN